MKYITVKLTRHQLKETLEALAYVNRPSLTPIDEQRAFIKRIEQKLIRAANKADGIKN